MGGVWRGDDGPAEVSCCGRDTWPGGRATPRHLLLHHRFVDEREREREREKEKEREREQGKR